MIGRWNGGVLALFAWLMLWGCAADAPDTDLPTGEPAQQLGQSSSALWLSAGHDSNNTRNQPLERRISPQTVSRLKAKWIFRTDGDAWTTPAVDETAIYIPDMSGSLFAIDRRTGKQIWRRKVGEITGTANAVARATPTIDGDVLYLGDQSPAPGYNGGASFFALNKRTGATLWSIKLDAQPIARVSQSAAVHGDLVYVGLSSFAERLSVNPAFKCCPFRGSMVALNKKTGAVVWRTWLTPGPETGFSGVTVWGSSPVIDVKRNAIYIATGNNYTAPQAFLNCGNLPTAQVESCIRSIPRATENYFDAIVSLDLTTGKVKWARSMVPFDVWVTACVLSFGTPGGNCQSNKGNDYDFGQGVIAYTANVDGKERELLGVGQKSGVFWAVSPDDGAVVWSTPTGPGGALGGMNWGSAYDGKRLYAANANSGSKAWTFKSGEVARSGFWTALDPATGKILWETKGTPPSAASAPGSVTTANGVVFAGLLNRTGTMYAFDAASGKTLWSFQSGGSVVAGPAIADGTVYWGSGYSQPSLGLAPNNMLYAFEIDGTGAEPPPPTRPDAGPAVDAGPRPTGPSWRAVYEQYLGVETVGHCNNCHLEMSDPETAYQWLTTKGQINGKTSPLGTRGMSRLTWLGGGMPPAGSTSEPDAERDIAAWVAIGAPNN